MNKLIIGGDKDGTTDGDQYDGDEGVTSPDPHGPEGDGNNDG